MYNSFLRENELEKAENLRRRLPSDLLPFGLDRGDVMLLVMLLFLYNETGDDEFLIMLAVIGIEIFRNR